MPPNGNVLTEKKAGKIKSKIKKEREIEQKFGGTNSWQIFNYIEITHSLRYKQIQADDFHQKFKHTKNQCDIISEISKD